MAKLNVFGIGTATADPELRQVGENQTMLCTVNLAFNRSYKKGDEWKQDPTYIRAQIWGNRAEKFAELVKKGSPVYVDGYLGQSNWETNDGQRRTAHMLCIDSFQVCERFSNGNSQTKQEEKPPVNETVPPSSVDKYDEETPF